MRLLWILALGLLVGPRGAQATSLLGNWQGSWAGSGIKAGFDLIFSTEDPSGTFKGYFDRQCTSGINGYGGEYFSGTLFSKGLALKFTTTGIAPGVKNIGPATYWALLLNAYTRSGTGSSWGRPGLGLVGVGFSRRRKTG